MQRAFLLVNQLENMLLNYDVKVLIHIQSHVHEQVHVIVRKQRVLLTNFGIFQAISTVFE